MCMCLPYTVYLNPKSQSFRGLTDIKLLTIIHICDTYTSYTYTAAGHLHVLGAWVLYVGSCPLLVQSNQPTTNITNHHFVLSQICIVRH